MKLFKFLVLYSITILISDIICSGLSGYLRAHYKLDGNLQDTTGNFPDAIGQGINWADDKDGNNYAAAQFYNNDCIIMPVEIMNGLQDYSISFWIMSYTPTEVYPILYSLSNSQALGYVYTAFGVGETVISSEFYNWNRTTHTYTLLTNGEWQHIVFSRSTSEKKYNIYADGVKIVSFDSSEVENSYLIDSQHFILGRARSGPSPLDWLWAQFKGRMQDVRIYSKSLTDSEVNFIKNDACPIQYRTEGNSCVPCSPGCNKCDALQCTECQIDNYYIDGGVCNLCNSRCKRCSNSASCDECQDSSLSTSNQCCQLNQYFDTISNDCKNCEYPCLQCSNSTNCLTCDGDLANRNLDPDCKCSLRYYNEDVMGINTCKECPERYQDCQNPSTPLVGCRGSNRKDLDTYDCVCLDNHYEDPISENCLLCQYPCLECNSLTNCFSCDGDMANRNSDPDCKCTIRYYNEDVMGVNTCKECPQRFQACENPTTPLIGCRGSNRKSLESGDCQCMDNYFENDAEENCISCQYPCLVCGNSSTDCLSCDGDIANRNSDPDCNCISRYYNEDVMGVNTCKECPERYQECQNDSTPLISCRGQGRKDKSLDCICLDNHFEDPDSENCLACIYPCLTCENSSTNCILCDGIMDNRNPPNNCHCNSGYYNKQEQNGDNICVMCPERYLECEDENTPKNQCKGNNRQSISQDCKCQEGFYEDPNSENCISCSPPCLNCLSQTVCLDCLDSGLQYPQCKCLKGSYSDTINPEQCNKCPTKYKECISENEGICSSEQNTDIDCNCLQGFYQQKPSSPCQKFQHFCSSYNIVETTGEFQCAQCSHETRENPPLCNCKNGYMNDGLNTECIIKPNDCINCVNIVASGPQNGYLLEFYLNNEKVQYEQDSASNSNQGFTLVIVNEDGETVLETKNFNVVQSQQEVQEMIEYIKQLPQDTQTLIGGQQLSDVSNLTPEFYEVMTELGAPDDLQEQLLEDHVFIMQGQKGMEVGLANVQIVDENEADQNPINLKASITVCYKYKGECYKTCPKGTNTIEEEKIYKDKGGQKSYLSNGPMIVAMIISSLIILVLIQQSYSRYKRLRKSQKIIDSKNEQNQNLEKQQSEYDINQDDQKSKQSVVANTSSVISIEDQYQASQNQNSNNNINNNNNSGINSLTQRSLKNSQENGSITNESPGSQNSLQFQEENPNLHFQSSPVKKIKRKPRNLQKLSKTLNNQQINLD